MYLSFGSMYTDIVFVNPFSFVQFMFIFLDYILNQIYLQYKKRFENIKPHTDLNISYCICTFLHIDTNDFPVVFSTWSMDVATAWIGNNILSVDFDHFFEYSLDKINMQYIS